MYLAVNRSTGVNRSVIFVAIRIPSHSYYALLVMTFDIWKFRNLHSSHLKSTGGSILADILLYTPRLLCQLLPPLVTKITSFQTAHEYTIHTMRLTKIERENNVDTRCFVSITTFRGEQIHHKPNLMGTVKRVRTTFCSARFWHGSTEMQYIEMRCRCSG